MRSGRFVSCSPVAARRRLRRAGGVACAASLIAGFVVVVPGSAVTALAAGSAQLLPGAGQFVPVPAVRVLDTRAGIGGVPAVPLAASQAVSFPVTGVGQIPSSGVSDAYVVITAFGPSAGGALEDYSADAGNPGIWTVPLTAGQDTTVSDLVQVAGDGTVSLLNASSGTTDVSVTVLGYVTDDTAAAAGQTYAPLPYGGVLDTRSGFGEPQGQGQIPAGGSVTVQVTGHAGVPTDAAGAVLYLGAADASQAGWISAFAAGSADPGLRVLSYQAGQTVRNLWTGQLSSSGQVTLVNHGPAAVDLMAAAQGYLVSPSAAEAGDSWAGVPPARIADTRDGTGGVPATPVPAGGSVTFTATGTDGVPSSGVGAVVESVAASNPAATGLLSVYPAGGTDPGNAGVNFTGGDSQDNDLTAPMVSQVSQTGQETITNHSAGTVDVIVTIRGFYASPTAPDAPGGVSVSVSGSSATVTWSPPGSDGGAAVTGYTVTEGPDNAAVSVAGTAAQATLTGLAHAAADAFTVTAVNGAGTSDGGTWAPPGVITGTVLSPDGRPVQAATVQIEPADPPASNPADWTPSIIGTATTDANGVWAFTVPPYSALPADAQAAADNDGGNLNLDATAFASATVGNLTYGLSADAGMSAYVGTSASPSGPVQVADPSSGAPAMTVTPDQADISSQDTEANEEATAGYQNNPTLTDANGYVIGPQMNAYTSYPADPYDYQNIAGPNNDGYNPFIAADGTNLSGVTATGAAQHYNCAQYSAAGYRLVTVNHVRWTKSRYTIVGEFHSNWDTSATFKYEQDSESLIGGGVSHDGEHFRFDGMADFTLTHSGEDGLGGGAYTAHHVSIALQYQKIEEDTVAVPSDTDNDNGTSDDDTNAPHDSENAVCHKKWKIQEDGLYDPAGATAPYIQVDCVRLPNGQCDPNDNTMWQNEDGYVGYELAFPRSYRHRAAYLPGSQDHCDSSGRGYTYSVAAAIGNFGIQAETDHAKITVQCIYFGSAGPRRPDSITGKNDSYHWLWGSNAKIPDSPKIFYSY